MPEWYVRTYVCDNGVEDKTKFPVPDGELPRRLGNRKRESVLRRAEKGATEARHELARILNCNFRVGRDLYFTLEYDKAGRKTLTDRGSASRDGIYSEAEHQAELYIDRVRKACRKAGIPLRYVYVTSDLDGRTPGKRARIHHHLIVNQEAAEICREKWRAGAAWSKKLYGTRGVDLGDLAFYLIAQVRPIPGKARYHPSRGLKKAVPMDPVKARNPAAPLRVPEGCELLWASEHRPGRAQHIRYLRC